MPAVVVVVAAAAVVVAIAVVVPSLAAFLPAHQRRRGGGQNVRNLPQLEWGLQTRESAMLVPGRKPGRCVVAAVRGR